MKPRQIATVAVRLLALYLVVVNLCDVFGTILLNEFRKDGLNGAFPAYSLVGLAVGLLIWFIAPWLARNSIRDAEEEAVKIDMAQFVACAIAGIFLWVMASNVKSVAFFVLKQFTDDEHALAFGSIYRLYDNPFAVCSTFLVSLLLVLFAPRLGIAFENAFSNVRTENDA